MYEDEDDEAAYQKWVAKQENPTDVCPEDGEQPVTGHGVTFGHDPYGVTELACGHSVICFGPGEDNVIFNGRVVLP